MTAFFLLFSVGAALAFMGKLTAHYVALGGMLYGFVIFRAVSEDRLPNAQPVMPPGAYKEGV